MGAKTLFTGAAVMAAISLMLPAAAPAQTSRAGVVTTLQGTATVARTSTAQPAALKFRDDVFVQDRISTGDESIVRILLGGKAVVTVRERSHLTITETPTTSTIELASGKIALSVDKSRVKPGESVEIKAPNAVAAIRGTIIVAEVDSPTGRPSDASTTFTLLTGVVDVTRVDPSTGRLAGPPVVLRPLQAIGVTGLAPLDPPRPITRAEAARVAASFTVPIKDPSPAVNARIVDSQVQEAVNQTAALTTDTKVTTTDKSKTKDDGGGSGSGTSTTGGSGTSTTDSGGNGNGGGSAGNGGGNGNAGGNSGNAGGGNSGNAGGGNAGGNSGNAGGGNAGGNGGNTVGSNAGGNSGNAGGSNAGGNGGGNAGGNSGGNGGGGNSGGGRIVTAGGTVGGNSGRTGGGGLGVGVGGLGVGSGGVGGGGNLGGDDLRSRDRNTGDHDRRGRDRSR